MGMQMNLNDQNVQNHAIKNALIGAWQGEITITNHENLSGFATLFTFHQGGTMSETHPQYTPNNKLGFGPLQATPGQGIWRQVGDRQFEATFALLIQGAAGHETLEGQLIGINQVTYQIEVDETGKQLTGQWRSCLKTPQGDIIVQGQGDYTARRIEFAVEAKQSKKLLKEKLEAAI